MVGHHAMAGTERAVGPAGSLALQISAEDVGVSYAYLQIAARLQRAGIDRPRSASAAGGLLILHNTSSTANLSPSSSGEPGGPPVTEGPWS
jgi:hypothetical protein